MEPDNAADPKSRFRPASSGNDFRTPRILHSLAVENRDVTRGASEGASQFKTRDVASIDPIRDVAPNGRAGHGLQERASAAGRASPKASLFASRELSRLEPMREIILITLATDPETGTIDRGGLSWCKRRTLLAAASMNESQRLSPRYNPTSATPSLKLNGWATSGSSVSELSATSPFVLHVASLVVLTEILSTASSVLPRTFFLKSEHRWARRVFDLQPGLRPAGLVRKIPPLRHDASKFILHACSKMAGPSPSMCSTY